MAGDATSRQVRISCNGLKPLDMEGATLRRSFSMAVRRHAQLPGCLRDTQLVVIHTLHHSTIHGYGVTQSWQAGHSLWLGLLAQLVDHVCLARQTVHVSIVVMINNMHVRDGRLPPCAVARFVTLADIGHKSWHSTFNIVTSKTTLTVINGV